MILVDTSALIGSLTGARRAAPRLRALTAEGERFVLTTLVLYEWWRGPRTRADSRRRRPCFRATRHSPLAEPRHAWRVSCTRHSPASGSRTRPRDSGQGAGPRSLVVNDVAELLGCGPSTPQTSWRKGSPRTEVAHPAHWQRTMRAAGAVLLGSGLLKLQGRGFAGAG